MPVAGAHYPHSTGELGSWFATDADCLDYLEWLRWPEGFVCPRCGHRVGWRMADGRFRCGCLRRSHVGDGGDDLRQDAHAADGVVHPGGPGPGPRRTGPPSARCRRGRRRRTPPAHRSNQHHTERTSAFLVEPADGWEPGLRALTPMNVLRIVHVSRYDCNTCSILLLTATERRTLRSRCGGHGRQSPRSPRTNRREFESGTSAAPDSFGRVVSAQLARSR
ncbi:MAG: transposase [Acidimicrobiales bacterium]